MGDPLEPGPVKLFDMLDGFAPVRNLLGVGDPDVHRIDGRWWMFLGGFQTTFRNNIFRACLPAGAPLSSDAWTIVTEPDRPHRAAPLVEQPPTGSWDAFGLHSPSYAAGPGRELVFYAGRGSRSVTDNTSPYAIGVLEMTPRGWVRRPEPVLRGTPDFPNVLEPKVRYLDGRWRMWYAATPVEAGRRGEPCYQVRYTESADGLTGWSDPVVLFSPEEGFYDAVVHPHGSGYAMLTCRSTNLYGRRDFPPQGLWWLTSDHPSGRRADWTGEPVQLLDARDAPDWYGHGVFGPTVQYDADGMYVFFAGVHRERNWLRATARRVTTGRRPPFPAPYYFTIGRARFRRPA